MGAFLGELRQTASAGRKGKIRMADNAQEKTDSYLSRLRQRLDALPHDAVGEILDEIRGHIIERATTSGSMTSAGVDTALAALGDPAHLANEYITQSLLLQAETVRSPVRILNALFRWASLSLVGLVVLLASTIGYFFGAVFIICALMKPIHPHTAGLWVLSSSDLDISLHLGFENAPVVGREVLGWWIVPLGLLAGSVLVIVTTRFALSCMRRYRRSLRSWRIQKTTITTGEY